MRRAEFLVELAGEFGLDFGGDFWSAHLLNRMTSEFYAPIGVPTQGPATEFSAARRNGAATQDRHPACPTNCVVQASSATEQATNCRRGQAGCLSYIKWALRSPQLLALACWRLQIQLVSAYGAGVKTVFDAGSAAQPVTRALGLIFPCLH